VKSLPGSTSDNPGRLAADLIVFFLIAYAVSWLFWSCAILLHLSVAPRQSFLGRSLYFAGIQGPFLAGIALSWARGRVEGVRSFLGRIVRPPFNPIWLFIAIAIVPLIMLASLDLAVALGRATIPHPLLVRPSMGWSGLLVSQLLVMNGEEYGWRGYALPQMEKFGGTLGSSLLLGVLWSLWHVPLFYTTGSWQRGSIWAYVAMITATCVVQAAIFFRANQSVLPAMLFHGSLNASQFVLDLPVASNRYLPWMWALALLLAIALLPKPLFRWPVRQTLRNG
jgi:membrane protease YdiL (CAAX protease family)